MKKGKSGFTIVELLVVIAIIGVLMGLVTVAVGGSIRNGRTKRAEAMCRVVEQSIAMYYTKRGQWPDTIEKRANNMDGVKGDTYTFKGSEADQILREIVKKSTGSGASMSLIDASALFVADANKLRFNGDGCFDNHGDQKCNDTYCGNQGCVSGTDFSTAVKNGKGHIPLNNMAFGYQATHSAKFSRFWITYNGKTDAVTVSRKHPEKEYPRDWE